jgi:hypothetical protein
MKPKLNSELENIPMDLNDLVGTAHAMAESLKAIKAGKRSSNLAVGGVRLLERVTQDEKSGAAFFHLTRECRERLRAGGRLPWCG